MNDKIDNLIAQLKTEIENYIQAEVASRSKDIVSFPETVSESSSIYLPDFSAPTTEIGSTESSIGGKPMGESGIEAAPVEVAVPPMPTPTSLIDSSANSQEINNSEEPTLFARSGNPVTSADSDLPIPAPDFSLSADNAQAQTTNLTASDSSASASNSDFQMPTFVNSGTTTSSSLPDTFNAPVTDLPLPGSNGLLTSTNEVSIDEALANLPNLNNFSSNQDSRNNLSSSVAQNETVLPPLSAPSFSASAPPSSDNSNLNDFSTVNEAISSSETPTYDISEVTPKDVSSSDVAIQTDTSSNLLESSPSTPNASTNSTESGFSKAKGLLSRVLQKEWGKK